LTHLGTPLHSAGASLSESPRLMTEPRFRRYTVEARSAMLIEAGLACLARGGIQAFTVDNICREAKASRGLIAHHFGSKDGLLAEVYIAAYRNFMAILMPDEKTDLKSLIDAAFSADLYRRDPLNIWLALWGEVAVNPALRAEHRAQYAGLLSRLEDAIARHAADRRLSVDAAELALPVMALIDGLWLEAQIDPERLSPTRARAAAVALLSHALGPIDP
jgi:TetR/AcrR family transcriptional regulator, transcriptional repressor of bet genes